MAKNTVEIVQRSSDLMEQAMLLIADLRMVRRKNARPLLKMFYDAYAVAHFGYKCEFVTTLDEAGVLKDLANFLSHSVGEEPLTHDSLECIYQDIPVVLKAKEKAQYLEHISINGVWVALFTASQVSRWYGTKTKLGKFWLEVKNHLQARHKELYGKGA